jgi:CRISPR-associated protein Cas2
MRYVVAYDISSNDRRRRIADLLLGWGDRVQYSVFEIDVSARELEEVLRVVEPFVHAPVDRLRVWRLCASCQRATHAVGGGDIADPDLAWVV